jgi:hypothetical protein
MEVVMFWLGSPFFAYGVMAAERKNGISPFILA